jgi:teichuronic acid biosynthesis glycosyltransferase TuaH
MNINLTYIPYHDWRKILSEGNRTRDAHFIEAFRTSDVVKNLIIINRPITWAELIIKKKRFTRALKGELIFQKKGGRLYRLDNNTYLIDYVILNSIFHVLKGRKWYFDAYNHDDFLTFYNDCVCFLKIENQHIVSANIFSYKLLRKLKGAKVIDAWDNFNLIPSLTGIRKELKEAYLDLSKSVSNWTTNSIENIKYYQENFKVKNIKLITNGVDLKVFKQTLDIPKDLNEIKKQGKKIVGFGGKITHLFDYEIFNYVTTNNSEFNFIIIGQVLDNNVFSKILMKPNVFYLGDKHYDIYPNYIKNLDIGIVPYKINKNQHGGDSIKAYEYLASGLDVVGTRGNGLEKLEDYLNIADTKEEFSEGVRNPISRSEINFSDISWSKKVEELLL